MKPNNILALSLCIFMLISVKLIMAVDAIVTNKEENTEDIETRFSRAFSETCQNSKAGVSLLSFISDFENRYRPSQLDKSAGGFELGGVGELVYSSSKLPAFRLVVITKPDFVNQVRIDKVVSAEIQRKTEDGMSMTKWVRAGTVYWIDGNNILVK